MPMSIPNQIITILYSTTVAWIEIVQTSFINKQQFLIQIKKKKKKEKKNIIARFQWNCFLDTWYVLVV